MARNTRPVLMVAAEVHRSNFSLAQRGIGQNRSSSPFCRSHSSRTKRPALLKDAVATPAGCTVDGILELEEGGLRVTLIKAVVQASQRAKELLALRAKDIPGDDVG
jgi:hypothetical protein